MVSAKLHLDNILEIANDMLLRGKTARRNLHVMNHIAITAAGFIHYGQFARREIANAIPCMRGHMSRSIAELASPHGSQIDVMQLRDIGRTPALVGIEWGDASRLYKMYGKNGAVQVGPGHKHVGIASTLYNLSKTRS
jgi:hypothetical protein